MRLSDTFSLWQFDSLSLSLYLKQFSHSIIQDWYWTGFVEICLLQCFSIIIYMRFSGIRSLWCSFRWKLYHLVFGESSSFCLNIMKIENIWCHFVDKSWVLFLMFRLCRLAMHSYCLLCKNTSLHIACAWQWYRMIFSLCSAYHHYVQLKISNFSWTPSVFRNWGFL